MESIESPPLEVLPPAGVSVLDWMLQVSDAALIVSVDDTVSRLTAQDEWIRSTALATVLNVLKSPSPQNLRPSQHVTFEQEGGQALVGGVQVTAVLPRARLVARGERYLVFAAVNKKTGALVVGPEGLYWVDPGSGTLQRLADVRGPNEIQGASVDDVLARVRESGVVVR